MKNGDPSPREQFPTTDWSLLRQAPAGRDRLNELLSLYVKPLKAHLIWHKKCLPHDADDILQSFLLDRVICGNVLSNAEQARGRFRVLLLRALDNFLIDWHRRRTAAKRAPDYAASLDEQLEPGGASEGESETFEVMWALNLLSEAFDRMRRECEKKEREDLWLVWEGKVLRPLAGESARATADLCAALGLTTAKPLNNLYVTAQRMFLRLFRGVVADWADRDPEQDFRDFQQVLDKAGAVIGGKLRNCIWAQLPCVTWSAESEGDANLSDLRATLFEMPNEPTDLGSCLRQLLAAPVLVELGDLPPSVVQRLQSLADTDRLALKSPGDLLHHHDPGLEAIEVIKDFAKENRNNTDSPIPREVSTALYYGAVSCALVRYGKLITRLERSELIDGFDWVLKQDWIAEPIVDLVQKARVQVG